MAAFTWGKGTVVASGVYTYTDAGGEQTVYELATDNIKIIHSAFLDLFTMTQNGTVKLYCKVDGTNYREFYTKAFTVATDSDGLLIDLNFAIIKSIKITYTEESNEGAARAIPYTFGYENKI
jgi:hypothetical protein